RLPHRRALFSFPVCSFISGHYHGADRSYIMGHYKSMRGGFSVGRIGTKEFHDGFEPVSANISDIHLSITVTTNGKQPLNFTPISSHHIVEDIPRLYPKRFAGIEPVPKIRCFESCQVKQSIVNHCDGVRHPPV